MSLTPDARLQLTWLRDALDGNWGLLSQITGVEVSILQNLERVVADINDTLRGDADADVPKGLAGLDGVQSVGGVSVEPVEPTQPAVQTVDVRIAVAVDASGNWNSTGWRDGSAREAMTCALEGVDGPANLFWLCAELPITAVRDVPAVVEPIQ
jgi:hypothetical protein